MRIPDFLRRKISFNQFSRDAWVRSKAREVPEGSRVLDAGAGTCRYRALFDHCHYVTQDFCKSDVEYGKINYVCDINSIPADDGSFDVVLCTEVFEHTAEPIRTISELARVLKPGGRLFLTAPLGSAVHQEPYHFYGGFTPYWYQHFLPKCGFTGVKCVANGGFFKVYGQETSRVIEFLFPDNTTRFHRIVMFPVKAPVIAYFRLFIPLLCSWLDGRFDSERRFTAGYFVEARKKE